MLVGQSNSFQLSTTSSSPHASGKGVRSQNDAWLPVDVGILSRASARYVRPSSNVISNPEPDGLVPAWVPISPPGRTSRPPPPARLATESLETLPHGSARCDHQGDTGLPAGPG